MRPLHRLRRRPPLVPTRGAYCRDAVRIVETREYLRQREAESMREVLALVELERAHQAGLGPEPRRALVEFMTTERKDEPLQ